MSLSSSSIKKLRLLALALIFFIASLPFLNGYTPLGHDLEFHVIRIQGIAQALASGQFPVRMQYAQLCGYGYPVSIMYGDIFLYFPAFLTLLGISSTRAYSIYAIAVNAATVAVSYHVFARVFKSQKLGVLGCALYTLAPYRLVDIWIRAAVGEYTALIFLPAIFYGWYLTFFAEGNDFKHAWVWCALGVAGVVLTHVISVLLYAILFIPFVIYGLVHKHDWAVLVSICKSVLAFVALSAFFIVPFCDYFLTVDFRYEIQNELSKLTLIASSVLQPDAFFRPALSWKFDTVSLTIGWALLSGGIAWIVIALIPELRKTMDKKVFHFGNGVLCLALVFMFLASSLFPWYANLGPIGNKLIGLISTIQFSWRLLTLIEFLMLLLNLMVVQVLSNMFPRYRNALACAPIFLALFAGVLYGSLFLSEAKTAPQSFDSLGAGGC